MRPTALLVPLVGFDRRGYRLGYGGGYYDRTLATMHPKPLTIGIGYDLGRLETIHPQPHDIPMDAIVTEAGVASCFGEQRRLGPGEHGRSTCRRESDAQTRKRQHRRVGKSNVERHRGSVRERWMRSSTRH